MKKLIIALLAIPVLGHSQSIQLGANSELNVGTNTIMYFGGGAQVDGVYNNEGVTVVEQDVSLAGTLTNTGTFQVNGESALGDGLNDEVVMVNSGNVLIEGNTSVSDMITNDGSLFIRGNDANVVDGDIANTGDLVFASDVSINSAIDNQGILGTQQANATVAGTITTYPTSETIVDGDLVLTSPLINNGLLGVTGSTDMSTDFTNFSEANFVGETSFNGLVDNQTDADLVFASDVTFANDVLTNDGQISTVGSGTIDFTNNKYVGTINALDGVAEDGTPLIIDEVILLSSADTLIIDNLSLSTQGKITLPQNPLSIETSLNIISGVVNAANQEAFIVKGETNVESNELTPAYIEGKMVGVTTERAKVFPMGINGNYNFITLNSSTPGVIVKVECRELEGDETQTDDETLGLAKEVEWTIQTVNPGDTAVVSVGVEFSGVDLQNSSNFVRAKAYDASLQLYDTLDAVFHSLKTLGEPETDASIDLNDDIEIPSLGIIKTSNNLQVTNTPVRFAIGYSPILLQPEFYIPNAFAPQGVFEENHVFRPYISGATVSRVDIRILDSYKSEIYRTSMSDETGEGLDLSSVGWNGTVDGGLDAPEGVYYYNIRLDYISTIDGADQSLQTKNEAGSVILVK
ncbi:hypothetical protein [Reichenbachiella versicolor]|uniref:hypothetical protein n=1 Tax=Reichenbachiella versicolor TaxID=1821036 RepID=UPI000D6E2FC7|nr:hypothetical protein [Reichenbachiella versicolor]